MSEAASALPAFLAQLWRGERPLARALWWDMVLVGSLVNLAALALAMACFAARLPEPLGAALWFAPLPWNALLLVSVWRSAARRPPEQAAAARLIAVAWFLLAMVV